MILAFQFETHSGEVRTLVREGAAYVHQDHVGRIHLDSCATDHEHITKPLQEGEERRNCREYIEELLEPYVGKRGRFSISITFHPEPEEPTP